MDASYRLILLLMLCSIISLVFAEYYEDPEGWYPRISRFHKKERSCRFRRQEGFCHKRSECSKPTSQVCRSGRDPIVCCLDMDENEQKSTMKPHPIKDIDLSYPGCGFRSPKIQESEGRSLLPWPSKRSLVRCSGGTHVKANSWPWMVSLRGLHGGMLHSCGASLISQNYVLTAAHCIPTTDPSKFSVVVGAHTVHVGNEYPVRKILIHPGYEYPHNDIALIAVGRPVELSKKVYPVCLPSAGLGDEIETDNSNVTVTGWGVTSKGSASEILQEVTIRIVPLEQCKAAYGFIEENHICAGVPEGGKDACSGDSGGPLVSKLKDNSYVQLGIVSTGPECGYSTPKGVTYPPGIYTRVSQYTKWIYDNTDLGK